MGTLLPEKIYNHIRRKLLAGEVHAGTRLDYKRISAELGVSTTPVREAMGKLASEGFVDLIPRAGAIVRKLGEQEALNLYGVREAIETYAAQKAADMISPKSLDHLGVLLAKMRHLIEKMRSESSEVMTGESLAEFLEADLAFHMTIIDAAGNPQLTKLAGDSHIHSRIFGAERFGHEKYLLEEADQTHHAIYEALKEKNGPKASGLVAQHIHRSLELTVSHISRTSWWRNQSQPQPAFG
jgi:DNA-binding GntR family transcriptional regulator